MTNKKLLGRLLLIATYTALAAGTLTIIPMATTKEINIIGYKSMCSFTPVSTAICLLLANTFYGLRKKTFLS